ncbi:MAG TPA: ABC transporter ATP-binding protein [Candidatus Dormibacteraeota bacterium]|nr:ABC transporter ATP-binding protein [Candidatus Dormibacteraeota bacterium]
MNETLELESVQAGYGLSRVLHGVSLVARAGEVVSLLGRNGAGKSTTLKAIVSLVVVSGGSVRFDGHEITGLATHEISRRGVGYVPEDRRIFGDLTVEENLIVGLKGRGDWGTARVYRFFPKLQELAGRRAGSLSGGEQQMLTVARTLMGNPRVLLLDEPSEGLAPVIVRALGEQIAALKREGLTILLSEQNLKFAARLADRAYIIEKGEIRFGGPMAELMGDEALRRKYLTV